jgi:capsular polysaccharide export protein
VLLVPGQVESDASIAQGAPQIKRNIDLLRTVRQAHPDAYIVYKPHPDVVAKLRQEGMHEQKATQYCNELVTEVSITQLLRQVDEVHVMTSLTGFEALLHGCKVVTYGLPFYAGWGLTTDHCISTRRSARPTLTELIAATLIMYPRYVLPHHPGFASPEAALAWLETQGKQHKPFKYLRHVLRRAVARLTTTRH